MPTRFNGEYPDKSEFPEHFTLIFRATLKIYNAEQKRLNTGGPEDIPLLIEQLMGYAYNEAPFSRHGYDLAAGTPLQWWQNMERDSNADKLSVRLY